MSEYNQKYSVLAAISERRDREPVAAGSFHFGFPDDPLERDPSQCHPQGMKRIIVLGSSCAGKTTFSARLSEQLKSEHIELDALYWEANWKEADTEIFRNRVVNALETDNWIVDGNYRSKIKDIVWSKADTLIWLDPALSIVLVRFLFRSFSRSFKGELLWGGCKENLRNSIFKRNSLLIWILKTHHKRSKDYAKIVEAPAPGLAIHRLRSNKDVELFFENLKKTRP